MRPMPDFVVAGAARAGSTAVAEALRGHPDVLMSTPKEPHHLAYGGRPPAFTGPGDDVTINRAVVVEEADYRALFDGARADQRCGDGSVSTLYAADVAGPRLAELNPAARVVLVLRDPAERAFSSHAYLSNRGLEPVADFRTALALEPERIAAGWHHLWHYRGMSRYPAGVAALQSALAREQVGTWWYDDLDADPARVLAEIQEFLGLPVRPIGGQRVNASGAQRSRLVAAAMHRAASRPLLRSVVTSWVPFSVRERIRNANLRPAGLPASLRAELLPDFTDDLDRLEDVLGRPVPARWRR